jgi:hypothetical protein
VEEKLTAETRRCREVLRLCDSAVEKKLTAEARRRREVLCLCDPAVEEKLTAEAGRRREKIQSPPGINPKKTDKQILNLNINYHEHRKIQ